MLTDKEILSQIKTTIQEIIPDAKVYLFGSRATGKVHEESDWDILALTDKQYPKSYKWQIHDKLFPLSVSLGTIFQFVIATQKEWKHNPGHYTFQLNIQNEMIAL